VDLLDSDDRILSVGRVERWLQSARDGKSSGAPSRAQAHRRRIGQRVAGVDHRGGHAGQRDLSPVPGGHVASEERSELGDGLGTRGRVHGVGEAETGRAHGWRWVQLLGMGQTGLDHLVIEASSLSGGGRKVPAVYEGLSEMDPQGQFGWLAARWRVELALEGARLLPCS
jgi:hypothetical protein